MRTTRRTLRQAAGSAPARRGSAQRGSAQRGSARSGSVRRAAAITGAAVVAAAVLGACSPDELVASVGGRTHEERNRYTVDTAVTAVDVVSVAGDITVTESGRSGVAVTEALFWRGGADARPRTRHEVKDGVLVLRYECPASSRPRCWVDYRVEVPRGVRVQASGTAGNVTLRGLSGDVTASTGAGEITGEELTARRLVGRSGAGDVEVRFGAAPDDVRIDVGAGNGTVYLPAGRYAVTAETAVGERVVGVDRDDSAPHRIVVRSGAGDAKVLRLPSPAP